MNCNPTLTADEFKTIHNAVCDLDSLVGRLEEVLRPELYEKLVQARNAIRTGLASAYDQDDQAFSEKSRHFTAVQGEEKFKATWSLYEIDDLDAEHPYPADSFVTYKNHWGENGPVHCAVYGRTWRDLYRAADNCIRLSGDEHHVFIESFVPDAEDPHTLVLSTGS
jgi:hypothetical protein